MTTKHQVLMDNKDSLLGLAEYARGQRITHLWIMPESENEVGAADFNLPPDEWDSLPNWQYAPQIAATLKRNTLQSVYTYKKEKCERHPINITWLKHCKWAWNTPGISPTEVYQRVNRLERLLGVSISGSPSGAGMRYLKALLRKENHIDWLDAPEFDLASIPWDEAATPLIWCRIPTQEELQRKFLWAVDKNGSYPKGAKNSKVGVGAPVHLDQYSAAVEWQMAGPKPGIWLVTISEGRAVDSEDAIEWELLPPIVKKFNTPTWLTTPMVKLARKRGHHVVHHEAWIFPKSEYVWRKWAENLWNFRQQFPAGSWEKDSIKQIMNDTLGLLRSQKFGGGDRYRPDHNAMIVGDASVTMHTNAYSFAQAAGIYPVMCMIDCWYYLSDEPNIEQAIPGCLEHMQSLGGYKKKWGLEVDTQVRRILQMGNINKQLTLLNIIASERGI